MISEQAIQKVQSGYADSKKPFVFYANGEPKHVYHIGIPGDENRAASFQKITTEPAPREYAAESIDGLCAMVTDLSSKFTDHGGVKVFAGRTQILVVFGEENRRDKAFMPLRHTEAFQTLVDADAELDGISQPDLLWTLRSQFNNNVGPASFVPNVKQMRFKRDASGMSDVSSGRESMGKQVMSEVVGITGDFPEIVTLTCQVYTNFALAPKVTVECALRVNLEQQTFTLKPIEGEIERCRREMDAWLAEDLTKRIGAAAVVYASSAAKL